MSKTFWCADVPGAVCCDSCHDDVAYGFELLWTTLPDGREFNVCCAVLTLLAESVE